MTRAEQIRKVGDEYPPLTFVDGWGFPLDLRGCRVSYTFVPDSPRAKTRRNEPLRLLDAERGVVTAPRPRATGLGETTIQFPNGDCYRPLQLLRWVR